MSEKTYKILITDDDRFLLDMYALKFRAAGFTVFATNSGDAAIEKLREEKVDAILMDIIMPEKDGFETLEIIQKEKLAGDAKIIMLTNQGKEDNIDRARELGAVGYIVKASAVPSEVLSRVREILHISA